MTEDLSKPLLQAMLAADRTQANALIDDWAHTHSYRQAIVEILEPTLEAFGEIWATENDVSLAQGYISAKIAEDLMAKALAEEPVATTAPEKKYGPVILGNIEDDYHALGRKMVSTFLRSAGWQVCDLGNDVLPTDFVDAACEHGAKVIGASAMMYTTAINIKNLRSEIDRRGLTGKLQLAVGGAVFQLRPELVAEVGGDGTTRNALGAPDLMQRLWQRAVEAEGKGAGEAT